MRFSSPRSGLRVSRGPLRDPIALVLGGAFLLLQVGLIAESRFGEDRHFCWAPHTTQVEYSLAVEVDGRRLGRREISERYGLLWQYGWEVHSVENLKQLIRQRERGSAPERDGRSEERRVLLTYSVNGRPPETWRWPDETGP